MDFHSLLQRNFTIQDQTLVSCVTDRFFTIWATGKSVGFAIHWHELAMGVHVSHHPEPSFHLPSHLSLWVVPEYQFWVPCFMPNLDWSSVFHMVIYMFQCYSLKSSHPGLLPQSPKVRSLRLCLFCCLAYRIIVTIFLNFLIARFLSPWLFHATFSKTTARSKTIPFSKVATLNLRLQWRHRPSQKAHEKLYCSWKALLPSQEKKTKFNFFNM